MAISNIGPRPVADIIGVIDLESEVAVLYNHCNDVYVHTWARLVQ